MKSRKLRGKRKYSVKVKGAHIAATRSKKAVHAANVGGNRVEGRGNWNMGEGDGNQRMLFFFIGSWRYNSLTSATGETKNFKRGWFFPERGPP